MIFFTLTGIGFWCASLVVSVIAAWDFLVTRKSEIRALNRRILYLEYELKQKSMKK